MNDPGASLIRRAGRWLAGVALLAFPRAFRRRFGPGMLEDVEELYHEEVRRGLWAGLGAVTRTVVDLGMAGLRERFRPSYRIGGSPREHGAMASRSPTRAGGFDMLMDVVRLDLRFAMRSLLRRPGFAAVAVLTLGLGIGATSAVFGVVNGVLLRPLPYLDPGRLAMLWSHGTGDPEGRGYMSPPDLESVRELDGVAAAEGFAGGDVTLTGSGEALRVEGARVTGGLLELFGLAPALGRDLRREENVADGPRVAMLSWDLWQNRFGGDPSVVGRTMELSEQAYEIVGVTPEGFDFPGGSLVWRPYYPDPEGCGRGCHIYQAVARVAEDVEIGAVNADLERLSGNLEREFPASNFEKRFRLEPLLDAAVGDVRAGLWIVLGAVALVLLIVCANVANLLLVRASTRRGEVAVRAALGASRRRLAGQVLLESLVLAAGGALLGLGLAVGGVELLRRVSAGTIPRMEDVAVDGKVLLVAAGLTVVVTLLSGLSPALHLAHTSVMEALGKGGRGGRGPREARSRSFLLAGEVGLSLVLLVGAGLLARSLVQLRGVDLGLPDREVVRFGLNLPSARYGTLEEISAFYQELERRLQVLPGVTSAGSAFGGPLRSGSIFGTVVVAGRPEPAPADETDANVRSVTPGYLETLGYRILRGRGFEATDVDGPPVALVNETFVDENFPGEDPLGRRVEVTASFGWGRPTWTVVGVVADVRPSLRRDPPPEIYVPHAQFGPGSLTVNVRGAAGAAGLASSIRSVVRDLDPDLPLVGFETMAQAVRRDTAVERFYLIVVGLFAGLAVLLAAVGLYGVVAYLVSRRTREFGIRIALGARRPEITGLVLRQAVAPMVWGIVGGLAAAFIGVRVLESVLFQVEPRDPLIFAGGTTLVVVVALLAALLPARRAAGADPVAAVNAE